MLFQPLSLEYLQSWGGDLKDAPTHLVEEYYDGERAGQKRGCGVVPGVVRRRERGVHVRQRRSGLVASVNGQPADMEAFVEALRLGVHGPDEFITLEVTRGNVRNVVVLEASKLKEADELVRSGTNPHQHSVHFRDIHEVKAVSCVTLVQK